jgi:hypothetical protein
MREKGKIPLIPHLRKWGIEYISLLKGIGRIRKSEFDPRVEFNRHLIEISYEREINFKKIKIRYQ